MKVKTAELLGVKISALNYQQAIKMIEEWIKRDKRSYVCVSAVHLIMECYKDRQLMNGVNKAGIVTTDGMPLVWYLRHVSQFKRAKRVYGPDLTLKLCKRAAQKGYRVFFLGGARGETEMLEKKLKENYPGLKVVGRIDTPVRPLPREENLKAIKKINNAGADIVFVGLGCPYQEKWMIENRSRLTAGVLIGVGAAFDFITGRARQAPKWMQERGLEWLFRLSQNPRRLMYRYTILNLKFIGALASDYWKKSG